jgi:hypothetical protein
MAEQPLDLTQALDFTADDLAANREGRLSEAQRTRLQKLRQRSALIGVGAVVGLGLMATIILFLGQGNGSLILNLVGIGVTICNAALAGVLVRSWLRLSADINANAVQAISGTITHKLRVTGRSVTYILNVDGEELIVARPIFRAFDEGKGYRLYRTASSRLLLSAEAL